MKIRFGFVSNSSSMSFIVAFPNKIKTRDELRTLLFENISDSFQMTDEGENEVNNDEIISELFKQIQAQKPNDEEKAIDRLKGFIMIPKDAGVNLSKYNTNIFQRPPLTLKIAKDIFNELKKKDMYVYTFTFDTTDYIYQVIARSLLFINLDHIHIVNH